MQVLSIEFVVKSHPGKDGRIFHCSRKLSRIEIEKFDPTIIKELIMDAIKRVEKQEEQG